MARAAPSKIVAGLDIGTSRSAWACSIQGYADDSVMIEVPKGALKSVSSDMKTDTAILLSSSPPNQVEFFGRAAVEKFIERSEDAEASGDWIDERGDQAVERPLPSRHTGLLFRWFKKELCERRGYQSVDDPVATADGGQQLPLLLVMISVLRHFKKDVLAHLSSATGVPQTIQDVMWVITVPAIYDNFSKRFMRVAAHKAGLIDVVDSPQLQLCLEPEAACLAVKMKEAAPLLAHADMKVMIVDCGGGTVDITTHNIISVHPTLSLAEILPPTGGPWGSTCVDEEFKKFIRQFIGEDAFARVLHTSLFYSLLIKWEEGKTAFGGGRDERVRLNMLGIWQHLGFGLGKLQESCEAHNRRNQADLHVAHKRFFVDLPSALVKSFFTPTLTKIATCLRSLKRNTSVDGLKYAFLVGGFSASPLIQAVARVELEGDGCIVVPALRPAVAIVRGAVLYANNVQAFKSRVASLTYGLKVKGFLNPEDPEHVQRRPRFPHVGADGRERIDIFSTHLKLGDEVPVDGACYRRTYRPLASNQSLVTLEVMASHEKDISFPDKGSVFILANLTVPVDMTASFKQRGVEVQFVFGGTEFAVNCFNAVTGERINEAMISLVQEVEEVS